MRAGGNEDIHGVGIIRLNSPQAVPWKPHAPALSAPPLRIAGRRDVPQLRVHVGQRLVVLAEEFPSNVYPWRELAQRAGGQVLTVVRPEDGDWTRALLSHLDERTALVAVPHCHWTDGSLLDLERLGGAGASWLGRTAEGLPSLRPSSSRVWACITYGAGASGCGESYLKSF